MDKEISNEEIKTTTSAPPTQSQDGPKTISAEEVKKESVQEEKSKKEQKKEKKELKKSLKKPKKKEKVDYVNLLLLSAIFLLLAIIITPPVLRKVMPKLEITNPAEKDKAIILSCTAINVTEKYEITSRTKYVKEETIQNVITYKKIAEEEISSKTSSYPTTTASPNAELSLFKNIRGVVVDENESLIIVTIYDYIAKKYTSNSEFMKFFQTIDNQKSFYTNRGYTCEEITS